MIRFFLLPTLFKKVITYKSDGNGVKTVEKELLSLAEVYQDNSIMGLYADATDSKNNGIIIYKDFELCLEIATIYNDLTAEQMREALQNYNGKMRNFSDFEEVIKDIIAQNGFVKNDVLYLLKAHGCNETLQKALEIKERIKQKQIQEDTKIHEEQCRKEEEVKAKLERRKAEKVIFLCGYADGKHPIQIERIYNVLSKTNGYKDNGKIEYKSRRDFIIDILSEGGKAEKKDGVITYSGSKWDKKQSNPKTQYRLYTADGRFYAVTKIEYDFAIYMMEKSA